MELRSRTVLVTGGGRRVGQAIAVALGALGMRVAVHFNRSSDGAAETVGLIEKAGGIAQCFGADLSARGSAAPLVAKVVDAMGSLGALVNSAAIMRRTPFGGIDEEVWDEIFNLNLRGPFLLAQAAAAELERAEGAIVNIADLAAFETWPEYIPHGISKSGIVYLTRALARTLAPRVRVNAVAPGVVLLPDGWGEQAGEDLRQSTPLRRLGAPSDVAGAVVFLLQSDYITGETIIVDGGRHVRT